MAYRLRPATKSDEPTIWKATMETVWADVPENEKAGLDRRAFEGAFREYADEFVRGDRGERFVAEDEAGRVLGYIILGELRPFFSPQAVAFVYDIWVAPDHRGKGIGKALVTWAGEWARKRGHRKIKLEVSETNARARHVYEALGFRAERRYMGRILE